MADVLYVQTRCGPAADSILLQKQVTKDGGMSESVNDALCNNQLRSLRTHIREYRSLVDESEEMNW